VIKMRRKGLMKGKGKGYKNVIGKDPYVHSQSARGIKQPQKINVTLKRVCYGREDTPVDKREYTMGAGQPVGTIKEFEEHFKDKDVKFNIEGETDSQRLERYANLERMRVAEGRGNLVKMETAIKRAEESKKAEESEGKINFYRDELGKISATRLSPYGKRKLSELDGAVLYFEDSTLYVSGNKLINRETGKVVDTIDNDRFVNKIIFKVM